MRVESESSGTGAPPAETTLLSCWKLSYRIPEACAATGYKRSKLYELIKAGKIANVKDGSCTLILRSELERYLGTLKSTTWPTPIRSPRLVDRRRRGHTAPHAIARKAA